MAHTCGSVTQIDVAVAEVPLEADRRPAIDTYKASLANYQQTAIKSLGRGLVMIESSDFRTTRRPLNHGAGQMPVLGFGTLIADAAATIRATRAALDAGFRHFDCAERYRNEREVGEVLQAGLAAGGIARADIFVTTKLWNTNHRPERVAPAFAGSLDRLRLDYLDLYLIHTPFAFQPGDDQDPRDQNGRVLYDSGVTLPDTWRAMESLVDDISALPDDAFDEINRIQTRQRFNEVVQTGSPGFIPRDR